MKTDPRVRAPVSACRCVAFAAAVLTASTLCVAQGVTYAVSSTATVATAGKIDIVDQARQFFSTPIPAGTVPSLASQAGWTKYCSTGAGLTSNCFCVTTPGTSTQGGGGLTGAGGGIAPFAGVRFDVDTSYASSLKLDRTKVDFVLSVTGPGVLARGPVFADVVLYVTYQAPTLDYGMRVSIPTLPDYVMPPSQGFPSWFVGTYTVPLGLVSFPSSGLQVSIETWMSAPFIPAGRQDRIEVKVDATVRGFAGPWTGWGYSVNEPSFCVPGGSIPAAPNLRVNEVAPSVFDVYVQAPGAVILFGTHMALPFNPWGFPCPLAVNPILAQPGTAVVPGGWGIRFSVPSTLPVPAVLPMQGLELPGTGATFTDGFTRPYDLLLNW